MREAGLATAIATVLRMRFDRRGGALAKSAQAIRGGRLDAIAAGPCAPIEAVDLVASAAICYPSSAVMKRVGRGIAMLLLAAGCPDEPTPEPEPELGWQVVHSRLDGALLSVWGTSRNDVWAVGADTRDGSGPLVMHFDGEAWTRVLSGQTAGDFWWVFGFEDGPVYMGGDGGVIVRWQDDTFVVMDTPGTETIFGIWGASPDDVWAVGGASEATGGFAWRLSGDAWAPEPSLPAELVADSAVWKIYGRAANDAWLVGANGVALHWNGSTLTQGQTGIGTSLFTVHERDGLYVAVGGSASGFIVELKADSWQNVTPDPAPMGLAGVTLGDDGTGIAVGMLGSVYVRRDGAWALEETGIPILESLHGSWIDDEGGLWAVGGQTFAPPLTDGVMIHWGREVPDGGL